VCLLCRSARYYAACGLYLDTEVWVCWGLLYSRSDIQSNIYHTEDIVESLSCSSVAAISFRKEEGFATQLAMPELSMSSRH
jgi:hypothetical protein